MKVYIEAYYNASYENLVLDHSARRRPPQKKLVSKQEYFTATRFFPAAKFVRKFHDYGCGHLIEVSSLDEVLRIVSEEDPVQSKYSEREYEFEKNTKALIIKHVYNDGGEIAVVVSLDFESLRY